MAYKRTFAVVAATLAAGLWTGTALSQEIKLKLSHYVPTTLGLHTDFMEPWARELESCSGGKVKVEIFPAGTALGKVTKQFDQVRKGVVDIAFGLHGIPRGRFPRTSLIEIPFITKSANAATRALWDIFDEHLAVEYPGVKVLALTTHNPGMINTKKPVVKPDDVAGLRVRTPSPSVSALLEELNATPVGMPPGQMYENLQKGTLDGATIGWNGVAAFKLFEVVNNHLNASIYTVSFFFAMNKRTYERLPDEVRACVDNSSGDALIEKLAGYWDAWDVKARKAVEASGNTIMTLDEAQRAEWIKRLAPVEERLIKALEEKGVENAAEIHKALVDRIAAYE